MRTQWREEKKNNNNINYGKNEMFGMEWKKALEEENL